MRGQITVRIPEDLRKALDRASQKLNRTPSEIVRRALRQFLNPVARTRRPAERVHELIGSLDSGIPDMAERHREYILESLQDAG